MNEKELTNVPGMQENEVVVIRKLGFGSMAMLRSKALTTNVDPKTMGMSATVDMGEWQKWLIALGVKKAPFFGATRSPVDRMKMIENDVVPAVTGEFLFQQIQKFNGLEEVNELKKE